MTASLAKCIPPALLAVLIPGLAHAIEIKTPNVPTVHVQIPRVAVPRFNGHVVTLPTNHSRHLTVTTPSGNGQSGNQQNANTANNGLAPWEDDSGLHPVGGDHKTYQPPPGNQQTGLQEVTGDHETYQPPPGNQQTGRQEVTGDHETYQPPPGNQQTGLQEVTGDHKTYQSGSQQTGNTANSAVTNSLAPNVGGLGSSNQQSGNTANSAITNSLAPNVGGLGQGSTQ